LRAEEEGTGKSKKVKDKESRWDEKPETDYFGK
jgi:hypothetical protein